MHVSESKMWHWNHVFYLPNECNNVPVLLLDIWNLPLLTGDLRRMTLDSSKSSLTFLVRFSRYPQKFNQFSRQLYPSAIRTKYSRWKYLGFLRKGWVEMRLYCTTFLFEQSLKSKFSSLSVMNPLKNSSLDLRNDSSVSFKQLRKWQ